MGSTYNHRWEQNKLNKEKIYPGRECVKVSKCWQALEICHPFASSRDKRRLRVCQACQRPPGHGSTNQGLCNSDPTWGGGGSPGPSETPEPQVMLGYRGHPEGLSVHLPGSHCHTRAAALLSKQLGWPPREAGSVCLTVCTQEVWTLGGNR